MSHLTESTSSGGTNDGVNVRGLKPLQYTAPKSKVRNTNEAVQKKAFMGIQMLGRQEIQKSLFGSASSELQATSGLHSIHSLTNIEIFVECPQCQDPLVLIT